MADTIYFAVENLIEKTIIFSLMVSSEINCIKSPFLQNSFFVNLFLEEEMVYAYIRVSTDGQTTENQKLAIKNYCRERRLRRIRWVAETISGTKNPEKRKLGKLIDEGVEGDVIVLTELSRLGRSLIIVLNVLQKLLDKKVQFFYNA